jgi:copper transport protein
VSIGVPSALILLRAAPARRHDLLPRANPALLGAAIAAAAAWLLGCGWRLASQAQALVEPGEPLSRETFTLLLGSSWGARWLWQFGAGVLLLPAAAALRRWNVAWPGLLAGAAVAMTLPLTGHAMEHPWGPAVGVLLQGAHVATSGVWLGTLTVLAAACARLLPPMPRSAAAMTLATLGARFSPLALLSASLLAAAGTLLGVVNVGRLGALASTGYGRLLLLKLALVGAIAALGALNWRRVVPALQHGSEPDAAVRRLSVSVALELGLAVLVLVVTALLSTAEAPALGAEV